MVTIPYKIKFNKDYFEVQAWQDSKLICGIDEVGRGCLAGPVTVAAAILHPNKKHRLLKDSKLLDNHELEQCYTWLQKNSWYAIALVNHRIIDTINIYQATLQAMKRAFLQLMTFVPEKPHTIVVDAMPLILAETAYPEVPVYYFPYGEQRSSSIAAASIIAKVTRDLLMKKLDTIIPGYSLAAHKGYCTSMHRLLVKEIGESIIHRKTFLNSSLPIADDYEQQQTLC